jgi:outer membrane receptor protein involved in Fe transport
MPCARELKKGLCAALAALTALAPLAARADEARGKIEMGRIDLESLLDLSVEAVTRRAERASEAPATVFVLTAEDLRGQGFRTIDEALGSVPGLFSYPGRFPQVGVRGLGIIGDFTTRLLVLIDGHPLTNSVGADLGRGLPLPLSAIARIEVIKGPVGSVYGPAAFFGVVNLVTTGAASGGEAWAGGEGAQGEAHTWEGSATWRGAMGPVQALVSTDLYTSKGRDWTYPELAESPAGPTDGVARGMDFGDAQNAYLRLRWKGLSANAACGHSYGGLPVAAHPNSRDVLESSTCVGELSLEGDPLPDLTVRARASFDWFEQGAQRETGPLPSGVGLFVDKGNEHLPTGELRADWHPRGPVRLGLGTTFQPHRVMVHTYSDVVPQIETRFQRNFSTSNTWLLAELRPTEGLTFHGGLTYFSHSIFGDQLTPKLAVVWQPTLDDTVKAIWSRGFRPPTYVEALLDDRVAFVANPELRPERVTSTELAYEHRFGHRASVTVSAFWNEYQNLIRYAATPAPDLGRPPDPSNPRDFRQIAKNAGALTLLGGEVAAVLRFGDALQGWGGISVQHVNESSRPNFPSVTGNLAVSSRAIWQPLLLSARAAAVGPRAKDPATLPPGKRTDVPAAVVLGCQAALDVPGIEGLQLEVAVQNLLDARAVSPGPSEMAPVTELSVAPRTFHADLRYRF